MQLLRIFKSIFYALLHEVDLQGRILRSEEGCDGLVEESSSCIRATSDSRKGRHVATNLLPAVPGCGTEVLCTRRLFTHVRRMKTETFLVRYLRGKSSLTGFSKS